MGVALSSCIDVFACVHVIASPHFAPWDCAVVSDLIIIVCITLALSLIGVCPGLSIDRQGILCPLLAADRGLGA